MSTFNKGDKVRVKASAGYKVAAAIKATKKDYLPGTLLTGMDPCCGCYIVQFNRNIGSDYTYGTSGKPGYCFEVRARDMELAPKKASKAASAIIEVGASVRVTRKYDGALEGMTGVVASRPLVVSGAWGLKLDQLTSKNGGHSLSGRLAGTDGDKGQWVPADCFVVTASPKKAAHKPERGPKVGDTVEVTKSFDAALKGMVGTIIVVPKPGSHVSYGLRIEELKRSGAGHGLGGTLTGSDSRAGQWVPSSHFRVLGPREVPKPGEPEVGDFVERVGRSYGMLERVKLGAVGRVVNVVDSFPTIGVQWEGGNGYHECDGHAAKGTGYYLPPEDLAIITKERFESVAKAIDLTKVAPCDEPIPVWVVFKRELGRAKPGVVLYGVVYKVQGYAPVVSAPFGTEWVTAIADSDFIESIKKR